MKVGPSSVRAPGTAIVQRTADALKACCAENGCRPISRREGHARTAEWWNAEISPGLELEVRSARHQLAELFKYSVAIPPAGDRAVRECQGRRCLTLDANTKPPRRAGLGRAPRSSGQSTTVSGREVSRLRLREQSVIASARRHAHCARLPPAACAATARLPTHRDGYAFEDLRLALGARRCRGEWISPGGPSRESRRTCNGPM